MAKYMSSSWGEIRGKLGDAVGGRARGGISTVRINTIGKHMGTEKAVLEAGKDESKREEITIRQFNQTHIAMTPVTIIAYKYCKSLMFKVWEPFARNCPLTGANLFTKRNVARLCDSLPDKTKFYSQTNMPDLSKIMLTEGNLESADITSASYSQQNCEISVTWYPLHLSNGTPEDDVCLAAIYWKIPESKNWYPDFNPCKTLRVWSPEYRQTSNDFTSLAKRHDGTAKLKLGEPDTLFLDMENSQLVVFLFLHNKSEGYSKSSSLKVNVID